MPPKRGLVALLKTMNPLEEGFPEIDDPRAGTGIRGLNVENWLAREGRPLPVSFQDILLAYEFVGSSGGGLHHAFLCRQTGKIYWRSEVSDLDEFEDELPDDVEEHEKYVAIPDTRELGLGKPLALNFAREFLPNDFDEVRYMFSKRGAYQKFRALLTRRNVLDLWYNFESKATEQALREWCKLNSIEVAG